MAASRLNFVAIFSFRELPAAFCGVQAELERKAIAIACPDEFIGYFDSEAVSMIMPATPHQQALVIASLLQQTAFAICVGIGSRMGGSDRAGMTLTAMSALLVDKASRAAAKRHLRPF